MTKLRPDKPLVRETGVFDHTEPLVVSLYSRYLEIRRKGQREAVIVDYAAIRELGQRRAEWRSKKGVGVR